MTVAFRGPRTARRLPEETIARPGPTALENLDWECAITLFLGGWAADHPGIRPGTLGHYQERDTDVAGPCRRGERVVATVPLERTGRGVRWAARWTGTREGRPN